MTASDTVMLIINPISGTGSKEGLPEMVDRRMERCGRQVVTKYTACRGDATRLAREAVDAAYGAVLVAGGDGTINETARALCGTGVPLGIIPAGSGNGLARHLGIPIDIQLSLNLIAKWYATDIDYGTVNGEPFFCTCGVGFDAAVSHRFAHQGKRGKLTYFKSVLQEFTSFKSAHYIIEADGKTIEEDAFLITIANASQYGNNAYIAPRADIADGLLDVIIVHAGNPVETIGLGADLMTGFIDRNVLLRTIRARNVIITRDSDGEAHIDGEPVNLPARLECKCHYRKLRVFTPRTIPHFTPLLTPIGSVIRDFGLSIKHVLE